jgi:2-polyprenyl-3-methyl-5-hydroxy-6-metoxy-1,4-benzoquinol methylase
MKCRLCKSEDLYLFYKQGNKDQFNYYKCENCSLVNLDITVLNTVKNQEKYAHDFIAPADVKKNQGAALSYQFIQRNIKKRGTYLDIGCGNGSLLYSARQDGWKVRGLELSAFLAKKIKETLAIEVDVANFLEFNEQSYTYDLVSLRHVLEHLPDSLLAMQKINSLLNIDGYALLEFPNIMGLNFRLKRLLGRTGLYKKKYSKEYVPGHCNEFSKKSFSYLAKNSGFELIRWETYSSKPLLNRFYRIIPIGIKVRALVQKVV